MGIFIGGTGGSDGASPGSGLMAALPRGYIDGLILSNNAGDATNDLDISPGVAKDSTGVYDMSLAASITKRLDATFVAGTNQGGLDTGAKANSTWYHVWIIRNDSSGVADVLFSTSVSAPTMPSGYTAKRRIGAIRTSGAGVILQFRQLADEFLWVTSVLDINVTDQSTTAVLYTLTVPTGLKVWALIAIRHQSATLGVTSYVSSPDAGDEDPGAVNIHTLRNSVAAQTETATIRLRTNTASQIRGRATLAATSLLSATLGWIDPRGKDQAA